MFWRFPYSTSQLHTLLDKEDLTLKELLDEEDVLQECKSNNEKLIDFLIKTENINKLIDFVVNLPSENLAERERFKYSCIACELLTCDIPIINEALINDTEAMNKLYMFLGDSTTLNPILGSYFSKIIGNLITRKSENFLTYIQQKNDFLPNLLKHINTSAIMDILLRLVALIDNKDMRLPLVEWLKSIKLVRSLADLFTSAHSNEIHSNVSQLLCEIIKVSREQILNIREGYLDPSIIDRYGLSNDEQSQQSQASFVGADTSIAFLHKNSLLDEIESDEIIECLFQNMLESYNKPNCSVTYILDIFFTILEPVFFKNIIESNDYIQQLQSEQEKLKKDKEKLEIAFKGIKVVTACCLKHFGKIHEMLVTSKPKNLTVKLTNGKEIQTLGIVRLSLIKLVSKLVGLNDESINEEVIKHGTINVLIEMLFVYKWNNFLHSLLAEIITSSVNSDFKLIECEFENQMAVDEDESPIDVDATEAKPKPSDEDQAERIAEFLEADSFTKYYLKDCNLVKRLVDAWYDHFDSNSPKSTDAVAEAAAGENKPRLRKVNKNGYMGHLTIITNHIYKSSNEGKYAAYIKESLNKWVEKELLEQWNELNQTKIDEVNKINGKDLVRNPLVPSSPDSSRFDVHDLDLPSDVSINKKLLDFNKDMQNYFGEPKFNLKQSPKSKMNESASMFEQVCMSKDFGSASEEDVWVTQDIKFADNSNEKDDWVSADENMFKVTSSGGGGTTDDMFGSGSKSSESTFLQSMIKKNESNLSSQAKSLTSKKYSENLSLTNYSSSSSSSSNENSDSDEDAENSLGIKKSHKSKTHQSAIEQDPFQKDDSVPQIREDISATMTKSADNASAGVKEEWADFDAFISAESAKDTSGDKNLENMLNNDPWQSASSSAGGGGGDNADAAAAKPADKNWANFDSFN